METTPERPKGLTLTLPTLQSEDVLLDTWIM